MEMEKRLAELESCTATHDKRLTEHGRQIDQLIKSDSEKDKQLALMRKDIENTNEAVKRREKTVDKIDSKLDKALEIRTDDHLTNPLMEYRKVKWQIITIAIGILVGIVIKALFPML